MGSFYANVTLLGTELDAAERVVPRPAFLLADGGAVVVFAEADDDGAPQSGQWLSAALDCLAVSIAVGALSTRLTIFSGGTVSCWSHRFDGFDCGRSTDLAVGRGQGRAVGIADIGRVDVDHAGA